MERKFLINRSEAKLLGVGSGLADYFGVDALVVRLALILAVLATGPIAVLLYVATGWLAAER